MIYLGEVKTREVVTQWLECWVACWKVMSLKPTMPNCHGLVLEQDVSTLTAQFSQFNSCKSLCIKASVSDWMDRSPYFCQTGILQEHIKLLQLLCVYERVSLCRCVCIMVFQKTVFKKWSYFASSC